MPTEAGSYPDFRLSFTYPRAWTAQTWDVSSSFTTLVTYLSTATLHDPCTRSGNAVGGLIITCGDPIDALPPGSVLVSWSNVGFPRPPGTPEVPNPNTTVAGHSARLVTERPGTCGRLGGSETMTADVERPTGNHFEMVACLRDPGVKSDEQLVKAMLDSTRIAG